MANAQILLLVAGAVPADTIRTVVEAAARANGFTPSAWTYAQGADTVLRGTGGETGRGTFSTGPWLGSTLPLPASFPTTVSTSQVPWTAFRMNLLSDRPQAETSQPLVDTSTAIRAGLSGVIRTASRSASNTIAWDRGIPAAIVLPEAGGGGSGGLLIGVGLVAAIAIAAGRGTSRQQAAMAGTKRGRRRGRR